MPSPLTVPLINAAANVVGTGINAFAQGTMNAKTRRWNEKMFNWERNAALADWAMQNEYNSPTAQMQRLRMAGLNPNLVYGSGATTEAGGIRGSQAKAWNPRAIDIGSGLAAGANSLLSYYDIQMKEAQTSNVRAQSSVLAEDAVLRKLQQSQVAASTANTIQSTAKSKFDLDLASELRTTSVEAAKATLAQTVANTRYTLDSNERQAVMQTSNLREAVERIYNMRSQRVLNDAQRREIEERILNLEKDGILKQYDIRLREQNIHPGDPGYWRVLNKVLDMTGLGNGKESVVNPENWIGGALPFTNGKIK